MISYIVPTTGRASLFKTLASIECWEGDEILVVGHVNSRLLNRMVTYLPCDPGHDWGHTERNFAMPFAKGRYLAHIDDDDTYVPGARRLIQGAIDQAPDRPIIFKMQYPNGFALWQSPTLEVGNVGTPMVLMPNIPEKLGTWGSFHGGDFAFLQSSKWKVDDYVFSPDVLVQLGHPDWWMEGGSGIRPDTPIALFNEGLA